MKKILWQSLAIVLLITANTACQKAEKEEIAKEKPECGTCPKICLKTLTKKWANTQTRVDNLSATGTIVSSYDIYPVGYFELLSTMDYKVLSNGVPLEGKWKINESCQLTLDAGQPLERTFDILKLTADSLVIYNKKPGIAHTQRYVKF